MAGHDERQQGTLQCPRCGSTEVHEYRMGINRYRIGSNGEQFDRVMGESEDVIFHRCVDCSYGSDTDNWEGDGESSFRHRAGLCQ